MKVLMTITLSAVLFVLLTGPRGWAQLQAGAITGAIEDATGGAVPNAKITATNVATRITQSAVSSELGTYLIQGLPPGVYQLTAESPGFKTVTTDGVKVDLGTTTTLNTRLELGSTVQTVEVSAPNVPLNTVNPDVETLIESKVVTDLPLRVGSEATLVNTGRRQIETFVFLVPGAQGNVFSHRFDGGVSFSNEVLFDGVPQVSLDAPGFFSLIAPPYESVDEFKVMTTVFSARYGRGQGIESYHFASGTNALHGDGFEFLRNDAFDARPFFAKNRNVNRQHEYGFTVGGPVVIPKVYDGRNRTFFHLAYSRFKFLGSTQSSLLTLPTDAFKGGDFSGLKDAQGNLVPIFDPICARGTPASHTCAPSEARTQFAGNKIDPTLFSSVSKQLLPLIPSPTGPGVASNFVGGTVSFPITDNDFSYKIDQVISSSNRVSFSHTRTNKNQSRYFGSAITGPLGGVGAEPVIGNFWVMNYQHTFSPNVLNSFGSSFTLIDQIQDSRTLAQEKNTTVTFPGLPMGPTTNFPGIGFGGPIASPVFLGASNSGLHTRYLGYTFADTLMWTRGRHTITLGGETRRTQENNTQCAEPCLGSFNFSNLTTSQPGAPNFLTAGHPFASFLLGIADSSSRVSPTPLRGFRVFSWAGFVQDDFKVSKKLTLNLGLRYDVFHPLTEVHDRLAYFDPNLPNPAAGNRLGALNYAGTCSICVGRRSVADIHHRGISPRLGFAYALNDKTVFRGGYSIIQTAGGANYIFGPMVTDSFKASYIARQLFISPNNGATPGYGSWDNTYPAQVFPTPGPSVANRGVVDYMGRDAGKNPYMQNWTLGVERELPGSILLTASYIGNHGVRLASGLLNFNQVDPKYLSLGETLFKNINSPEAQAAGITSPFPGFTGAVNQALRPYPQYQGINSNNFAIDGFAHYHALQITAQRRFSKGLQYLVSYTASKTMGNTFIGFPAFNGGAINTYNRKAENSIEPIDIPQSLTVSGIYELPLGPSKQFLNEGGALGKVVGGWQIGWVASYRGGSPVGVVAGNRLGLFGGGNRANIVPGVNPVISTGHFDPARDKRYNAAAFSLPADFTFGNAPRFLSNMRTFGFRNEDISLLKRTPITERVNVEFRIEFFNVFNRAIFGGGNPDGSTTIGFSPSDPNFGKITNQANLPRLGQASVKINF